MTIEKKHPFRVCLDARLVDGLTGGIQQVVIGLASGLSQLNDSDEEFLFLCYPDADEWLKPYISGPCKLLHVPWSAQQQGLKRILKSLPGANFMYQAMITLTPNRLINVPVSDGTIEKAGVDLMHFTFQFGFLTNVPSIYQPWDLQHLHLPQYFYPYERKIREIFYQKYCKQAQMVSVTSSWVKQDLIQRYHLPEAKVCVIPVASPIDAYQIPTNNDLEITRKKYSFEPESFLFYPAQTWPHKNHIGLLDSLAILRRQYGIRPSLVCSGKKNDFFPKIGKHLKKLQLDNQVRFIGFVSPLEMQCLYKLCRGVVFPSKFEGCGLPVMEAFQAGVPIACSNVTCLPELAGDAALFFDPENNNEIAEAIRRLYTDEDLRKSLAARGKQKVAHLSWKKTARTFRAHYRRLANRLITEEDRTLLAETMAL